MADQAPYPGRLGAKATAKLQRAAAKAQAKADRAAEREKARIEKANAKALAKTEEDKILKDLGTSLDTHNCSATFACGGSLPLKRLMGGNLDVGFVDKQSGEHANEKTHEDATASQDVKSESTDAEPNTSEQTGKDPQTTTIDPIQIRFGQSGKGYRAVFSAGGIFHHDLEQLVLACQPASFGRNGEAVQDEAYRKAGKLDRDEFATSFCPYGSGIVDVISQLLVPQTAHDKHSRSIKVGRCCWEVVHRPY